MIESQAQTSAALSTVPFELELLTNAHNYQKWIIDSVTPYLGNRILEVGAGIGNLSRGLPVRELLVFSEGERGLIPHLQSAVHSKFGNNEKVQVREVDLSSNWKESLQKLNFDTIVSFNVLEHVLDDEKAFADLLDLLKNSNAKGPKRLVTFVPAHQWAHGTIDQGFGHYRRYSHKDFERIWKKLAPTSKYETRYFNIVGLPSWFMMGRVLRRPNIGISAVGAFEKICPFVRGFDDFLHKTLRVPFGQSILNVLEYKS